jgi:hemolysin III
LPTPAPDATVTNVRMSPTTPTSTAVTTPAGEVRPALRGVIHGAMLPVAAAALGLLWESAGPGLGSRLSVTVFGASMLALYGVSSSYHLGRFPASVRRLLARLDVAVIQLFIAGTFTPIAFHALDGAWRTWSLVVAWVVALVGAGIAVSPVTAPRWVGTAGYIAFGWMTVVPFTRIVTALPWEGAGLIVLGGLLYTIGGVVYARRRPDPFPRLFGYHELFHVLVVAASTAHYVAIWRYVLPTG